MFGREVCGSVSNKLAANLESIPGEAWNNCRVCCCFIGSERSVQRLSVRPRGPGPNAITGCAPASCLIRVAVLSVHGPDAGLIFFEGIEMHHPVEDYGVESSAGSVTRFSRGDGSSQSKLSLWLQHFLPAPFGR